MIASLKGVLAEKHPQYAVIDVGGVGYRVFITLGCYEMFPQAGKEVFVQIVTIVREDAFHLYGFADSMEKEMFLKLISVTRVGPKLACGILSGIKTEALKQAVLGNDKTALSKVPGVGGKTSERIIMELKDKLGPSFVGGAGTPEARRDLSDAIEALVNLGYKKAQAETAVLKVSRENPDADIASIIRKALQAVSG
jgi:Holliday junction DNA helicase RuvA